MAVKWKPSATALCALCCFLIIVPNAFVSGVRVQSNNKRVKGAKGMFDFGTVKILMIVKIEVDAASRKFK